ncbi:hypothetical protein TrLO_g11109 [Triparma laevis f. longispina]|uniref:C2H2-type domain-containing protein n=1 Tax=Triparma laevis f. longispina TaxID=1714387 RepID=A0A9W7C9H4_9STRA|nr:hypothetical protein TrLO_g11109 [Triparma laevis f. longispina]
MDTTTNTAPSSPGRAPKRLKSASAPPGFVPWLPDLCWYAVLSYLNDIKELQTLRCCDKLLAQLCQDTYDRNPWMNASHCWDFRGKQDGSDKYGNVKDSRTALVAKLHHAVRDTNGMLCSKGAYATIDGWEWGGTTSIEVLVRSSFNQCYSTVFDFVNGDDENSEQVALSNDNKVLGPDAGGTLPRIDWRIKKGSASKFVRRVATCYNTEYEDPEVIFNETINKDCYVPHRDQEPNSGATSQMFPQIAEEMEKGVGRQPFRRAATHIVMTVCGSTMKVYKDGVLSATKTNGHEPAVTKRKNHMLGACMYKNGPAYYLDGHIMQLRMWHGKELQPKEVKALYDNKFLRSTHKDKIKGKLRIKIQYPRSDFPGSDPQQKHLFFHMSALKLYVHLPQTAMDKEDPKLRTQIYYVHPSDTIDSLKDLCAFTVSKLIAVTLHFGDVELAEGDRTLKSYGVDKDDEIRLTFSIRVPCNKHGCNFMSKSAADLMEHNCSEHGAAPTSDPGATFWPELQHENSKLLYNKDYVEQLDGTGAKDFEPDFETIIKAEEEEERLEEHLRFLDSDASDEERNKKPAAKVFPYPQSGKSDKCIIIKDYDVEAANPNPNFERRFLMTKGSIINYLTAPHKMSRQTCNTDGCKFQTNHGPDMMKKHKISVHGFSRFKQLKCGVDGCGYESKDDRDMEMHQAEVHHIDWLRISGPIKTREWECDVWHSIRRKGCMRCEKKNLRRDVLDFCTRCQQGYCTNCASDATSSNFANGKIPCCACAANSLVKLVAKTKVHKCYEPGCNFNINGKLHLDHHQWKQHAKYICHLTAEVEVDESLEDNSVIDLTQSDDDMIGLGLASQSSTTTTTTTTTTTATGTTTTTTATVCHPCMFTSTSPLAMRTHHKQIHMKFPCTLPSCNFKCNFVEMTAGELDKHKMLAHEIKTLMWCGEDGCDFNTVKEEEYEEHKFSAHGVEMGSGKFFCKFKNCGFMADKKEKLKKHRRAAHGFSGAKWDPHGGSSHLDWVRERKEHMRAQKELREENDLYLEEVTGEYVSEGVGVVWHNLKVHKQENH